MDLLTTFKNYMMAHPKLRDLHKEVLQAIYEPGGVSLLFILGATGVGKTTLLTRLIHQLTSDLKMEVEQNPGRIAVAWMEAEAPTQGNYNFKHHFKDALEAMGETLIDYRRKITIPGPGPQAIITNNGATASVLSNALQKSLRYRKPIAFFIDEAHHLGKVASGRKFRNHLDVIKSLANRTGTLHVLMGTYELHNLLNLSDQLSRRSRTFHFERYHSGRSADVKTFQNIIWNFQQKLPFSKQEDLSQYNEFLMERSLGCVGILKNWLAKSARLAVMENSDTLSLHHLKKRQPTNTEWRTIATALLEGEESFLDSETEVESLRLRLQQDTIVSNPNRKLSLSVNTQETINIQPKSKRLPGERRPQRDLIRKK